MLQCVGVTAYIWKKSELEKAIQSDAVEDVYIETQQPSEDEAQKNDVKGTKDVNDFKASNDQHPKDSNEAQIPYIGMTFLNWEEAYSFYCTYARMKGFRVRIGRTNVSCKRELDGSCKVFSKKFLCYKEGYRYDNDKRTKGKIVHRRSVVRVGCPAFLWIKPNSNGWVVHKFEANHNHPLVLEDKSIQLQSHKQLIDGVKLMVDNLHGAGIGQSQTQIVDAVVECFGGYNNIGVTRGTLKGHMKRNERNEKKMIEGDLQTVLSYFESMKEKDPGFSYSTNVSDKQTLSAIFWIDGKGRSDYEIFNDVVVFDTTYKKNRYRWPFGSFTGVNHHAQSILFGCGLVANETKESLEWLFKAWLNAMGDKAPKAIITNECTGIIPVVAGVFPKTVHRFCSWHVSKNALQHLSSLWFQKPEFKSEWKQCVYRSWSEADFLTRWEAMMVKYNLKDHSWLNEKFSQRKCWVPCYFRGTFFAGMSSTQRGEGMDSFFQGYFNGCMTLLEFVKQYETVVARRREKEADAEFKSLVSLPQLETPSPIEMHGRQVYTRRVFEIFKKNFSASLGLSAADVSSEGSIRKFKVGPFNVPIEHRCVVEYNSIDEVIQCSCLMFEFMGIPCKHFLKVLQMVDRDRVPSKYILSRWTSMG
ncbi:protein FAR1-RELATED SEQUENCE 5-like isoform X2 [Macadamia integrifolia]|uniref:protein FAR1-RELATED SEQUENCE 5-like isoform X2 n=1 Tax=Macadamia integrifolia TaxID=60698 RepID=UPI001C4FC9D8|nr:protein FAR1-RELATED SEQUENCE 5-like isoform X2 [Macadamia integrifolia]XP_042483656.1 protein FAR1-RELATED SEQUENCE 5-like isoform X2 [Macadamia integrifolia]